MMIKVNLLPPEYRRKDRTPIRVFGALIAGVLVICATGYYYVNLRFGELATAETELAEAQNILAGFQPQVRHHDNLVREKADYRKREQTIYEIQASRVSWTRNIDRLIDLVNSGESRDADQRGYLVWLGQLNISQNLTAAAAAGRRGRGGGASGGSVNTNGYCAAQHISAVTHFLDDLRGDEEFFRDFMEINDPKANAQETDENLEPSRVWNFPIELKVTAPGKSDKQGRKAK